jgi:hypothetical protein
LFMLFLQAVRGAVLDMIVQLVVSSSTFTPNCMQVRVPARGKAAAGAGSSGQAGRQAESLTSTACSTKAACRTAFRSKERLLCGQQLAAGSGHRHSLQEQLAGQLVSWLAGACSHERLQEAASGTLYTQQVVTAFRQQSKTESQAKHLNGSFRKRSSSLLASMGCLTVAVVESLQTQPAGGSLQEAFEPQLAS